MESHRNITTALAAATDKLDSQPLQPLGVAGGQTSCGNIFLPIAFAFLLNILIFSWMMGVMLHCTDQVLTPLFRHEAVIFGQRTDVFHF